MKIGERKCETKVELLLTVANQVLSYSLGTENKESDWSQCAMCHRNYTYYIWTRKEVDCQIHFQAINNVVNAQGHMRIT